MVRIKYCSGDVEKVNRARDTRFSAATMETHGEEDAPKETEHHGQRYNPVVKHEGSLFKDQAGTYLIVVANGAELSVGAVAVV